MPAAAGTAVSALVSAHPWAHRTTTSGQRARQTTPGRGGGSRLPTQTSSHEGSVREDTGGERRAEARASGPGAGAYNTTPRAGTVPGRSARRPAPRRRAVCSVFGRCRRRTPRAPSSQLSTLVARPVAGVPRRRNSQWFNQSRHRTPHLCSCPRLCRTLLPCVLRSAPLLPQGSSPAPVAPVRLHTWR